MLEGMNLNMVRLARLSHCKSTSVLSPYSLPSQLSTTLCSCTETLSSLLSVHTTQETGKAHRIAPLTCEHSPTHAHACRGGRQHWLALTFVRSIPSLTCDKRCMITLLCSSTDPASPSSSLSSCESKRSTTEQLILGWLWTDWRCPARTANTSKKMKFSKASPASLVPLDMEEFRDSVVSGRFKLFPELLCVKTEADPEELNNNNKKTIINSKTGQLF